MTGEIKHLRPVPRDEREREEDDLSMPPAPVAEHHLDGPHLQLDRRWRSRGEEGGRDVVDLVLRGLLLLLLVVAAATLLAPCLVRGDLPDEPSAVGTPARSFVKADRDYALVDSASVAAQKEAAAARSPSVWDFDTARAQKDAQRLQKGLVRLAVALEPHRAPSAPTEEGQHAATAPQPARRLSGPVLAATEPVRAIFAEELALVGLDAPSDEVWRALVEAIWLSPNVIDTVQAGLMEAVAEPVVTSKDLLLRDAATGVTVRMVPIRPGREQTRAIETILEDAPARAAAAARIAADVKKTVPALPTADAERIGAFAAGLVRATLTYNAAESDVRRRGAAEAVPPVLVRAHRGEIVLRPGEIITEQHRLLVAAMKVQQAGDMRTRAVLGTAFFVGLLCVVVYLFGAKRVFRRTLRTKDLVFLAGLQLLVLLGIVAADAAAPALHAFIPEIPSAVVFYAVPVAFGAMTVRLTLPPDVGLLFALVAALLGGVVVEPGMSWAVVAVVSSLTGAAGVSRSQRRSTMLLAGVAAGLVGAFAALTLELFRGALVGAELAWLLGAALAGGVLSGVLVLIVTPLVEVLFGYVTEQRLHRLADLNHPLLKDLIVHAPGTWHHSMRTAELAESAARSVGASAILARVMALYHDVGKIKQPLFFGENQKGDNPHDRIPAEESADVLRTHVEEGVRLATQHGLPRAVIAAIEEHHLDNVMVHFLNKAVSAAEPGGEIEPSRFRYRGRPPDSRESALVMLADQIEAASRAIDEPTPKRLCDLVDALVSRAIAEDSLGECDLSLRDLVRAREALQRTLLRLHRQELP